MVGGGVGSVFGPAVGAAGAIAGGLIGNLFNQEQGKRNENLQREFAQNGIRWKVADAKAAGIHPLYALGAQTHSFNPIVMEDKLGQGISQAGQDIGNALIRNQPASYQQNLAELLSIKQMDNNVRKGDLENTLLEMQIENLKKAGNGLGVQPEDGLAGPMASQAPNVPGGSYSSGEGMIDKKAVEQASHKIGAQHIVAGNHPAFELRYLAPNMPMILPYAQGQSTEELISEMSNAAWAGLVLRNKRFFGKGWMKDLVDSRYMGYKPTGKYNRRDLKNF